jgi:DNA-directed RNA polymerase specialized sigma24 family protein
MKEKLYDALYRLYFQEDDLNLFFELYRNFAFGYLEKTGFGYRIDFHSRQDIVQNASMHLLNFRTKYSKKEYPKPLFVSLCFNSVKWAAFKHLSIANRYAGPVEDHLNDENESDNDRYFPHEISEMALKLIETYESESVRQALKLYFFEDMFTKEIAEATGLWYRGMKHLINIFIIELKNQLTDDNISIEDYLKEEAPKTIFTQRRLREYIKRKTI